MEDMTAPDTMINFSEMPQQPNYYQLPQNAAHNNLNINFNMAINQHAVPSGHAFNQPGVVHSQNLPPQSSVVRGC